LLFFPALKRYTSALFLQRRNHLVNQLQPNPNQKQAILHTGSPLLVLAGAGSGKTRVITEKIAWLIRKQEIDPTTIAAVTFTNKTAREMKSRIATMFKGYASRSAKGLTISTFHSLGMRLLRSNLDLAGLRTGFSIIDPADAQVIIGDLLAEELNRNAEMAERILYAISSWKNDGLTPENIIIDNANPVSIAAAVIYPRYNRYLRACNSVDLDDLIFLPTQLLQNHEDFRQRWQKRIQYLLIDEYQDTNGAQYQLVKYLVGDGSKLTVVGDDDQSIYSWRGAKPENMTQLGEDYPNLTLVKLEQNYRSAGRILKVANQVISHNPRPFAKTLWCELGYGDAIQVHPAKNDDVEAEKVVSCIMGHQFRHDSEHRDFAILYRSNHLARALEIKLREMRIPYRVSGGLSFFDRSEIRDIMAYLRLITNPSDDTAFLRIINTPRRGIGASALEKITSLASQKKQSLFQTLGEPELNGQLTGNQIDALAQFEKWVTKTGDSSEQGNCADAVRTLLREIAYERWLVDSGDEASAERRWENVLSLIDWIEALTNTSSDDSEQLSDLSSVIAQVILSDILDKQKDDSDNNEVSLMTLHASKGLEFKHVFLVGVEEEILPHRVSIMDDAIEEERRLFYVGITRAMQTLTLSYCKVRRRFGELISCDPSRFLEELPADEIQWDDKIEISEEQKQESGRSHLAKIRAGLSNAAK
jgi:ATP-dependent DNA helicase Rep